MVDREVATIGRKEDLMRRGRFWHIIVHPIDRTAARVIYGPMAIGFLTGAGVAVAYRKPRSAVIAWTITAGVAWIVIWLLCLWVITLPEEVR